MGIQDRSYYRDGESDWNPAPIQTRSVVITLIIVNVAIFLVDSFTPKVGLDGTKWLAHFMSLRSDLFSYPLYFWQLLTYGFAHSSMGSPNPWHVVFNMITLFFLGRAVEQHYGKQEFLKFYLIAIVVAGLGWLAWTNLTSKSPDVQFCLGASGAVSAVVMLFIFNFPKVTIQLFGVLPIRAWILGVALIGMDLLNGFNKENNIAIEAHLAGAAFAAAYFYFKWNFRWLKTGALAAIFSRKPRLRVHNPEKKPNQRRSQLSEQADQILDKVHSEGKESLTKAERRTLEKYSRMVRDDRKD